MASEHNISRELRQLGEDMAHAIDETGQRALEAIEKQRTDAKRSFAFVADELEEASFRKDWQTVAILIVVLRNIATSK